MASPIARVKAAFAWARERVPLLDHGVRTQQHYGSVNGSGLAGAVTYFAFLSFFPIMALAFFVVGYISRVYPDARGDMVKAVQQVLPQIVGKKSEGKISLHDIESAAGTVGLIGLVVLLYSGLGWLSSLRAALEVVFGMRRSENPSFVIGKLRDLATLVAIGVILIVSVAVTGAVAGYSSSLRDLLNLGPGLSWLLEVAGPLVGLATDVVLLMAIFKLLARPPLPRRALRQGALMGAIAFEILKQASSYLLASTKNQPAFQAFGIALILLIWINYFSRVVMYAAAWAHTSAPAREAREADAASSSQALVPAGPIPGEPASATGSPRHGRLDPKVAFGAGAAFTLGLVALLRRRRE
jgi:membrane protein